MLILLLSLPRMASTFIYHVASLRLGKCGREWLHLIEPFNGEVMYSIHYFGFVKHDKLGLVHHDYELLRREYSDIYELAIKNSEWYWKWSQSEEGIVEVPFLGHDWHRLLKALHDLDLKILVKDVALWARSDEVVRQLPNVKIIFLIRDRKVFVQEIASWVREHGRYRIRHYLKWGLEHPRQVLKLATRLGKVMRYVKLRNMLRRSWSIHGLAHAVTHLEQGKTQYTTIEELAEKLYDHYLEKVTKCLEEARENIHVVHVPRGWVGEDYVIENVVKLIQRI